MFIHLKLYSYKKMKEKKRKKSFYFLVVHSSWNNCLVCMCNVHVFFIKSNIRFFYFFISILVDFFFCWLSTLFHEQWCFPSAIQHKIKKIPFCDIRHNALQTLSQYHRLSNIYLFVFFFASLFHSFICILIRQLLSVYSINFILERRQCTHMNP